MHIEYERDIWLMLIWFPSTFNYDREGHQYISLSSSRYAHVHIEDEGGISTDDDLVPFHF